MTDANRRDLLDIIDDRFNQSSTLITETTNSQQYQKIYKVILFAEFWEMFSFFGVVSILVLYTTSTFLYKDDTSYLLYSVFLTFFCGFPIVGGLLTDKYLTPYVALIIGSFLMMLGNILLIVGVSHYLFLGLAAIICGAALFKPTCTNLIGKLTEAQSNIEQENAFSKFYVVLNLGAMAAPVLYGIIGTYLELNYCFLLGAIGIGVSFFLVYITKRDLTILNAKETRTITGYSLIVAMLIVVTTAFFYASHFDKFILLFLLLSIFLFLYAHKNQNGYDKRKLFGLLYLLLFCMVFFTSSLQVGSTLTLYIERFAQRQMYHWNIPTSFFASLNPLFLVLTAPVFKYVWVKLAVKHKEPSIVFKLALGLGIGGIGFVFFWLSSVKAILTHQYISLSFIILGYFFLGAGEICLSPAVLNAINKYSPKALANTMMGAWYLFMAFSGYLGGVIDRSIIKLDKSSHDFRNLKHSLLSFQYTFTFFTIISITLSCILFLTSKKMMRFFSDSDISTQQPPTESRWVSIKD